MIQIYQILNLENGKSYIGKTARTLHIRWRGHIAASKHYKHHFSNAIRKHGENSFLVLRIAEAYTEQEACDLEKGFIQLYQTHLRQYGYNSTLGGDGVSPSPEIPRIGPNKGKKFSPETCKRISDGKKANPTRHWLGKKFTPEHVHNMSLVQFRKDISDTEIVTMYQSGKTLRGVADILNCSPATIAWRLRRLGIQRRPVGFHTKKEN